MYEFNYWGRDSVLAACDNLTEDELPGETPTSFGSIRNPLVHILNAEWIWRVCC
ncbi:MAG: hypothetical protein JXA42_13435 [Anaerolineales bacterium]|nr:hypothetical protein [Anaerolineales bacterium]